MLRVLLCAFAVSFWIDNTTKTSAAPLGTAQVYRTVDGRDLRVYVAKPEGWLANDKRSAFVCFHGGGWVGGAPGQFSHHCEHLLKQGFVTLQVEYRLLDRKKQDPPEICVQDAAAAFNWVHEHAAELGIDPAKLIVAGGSAGGHLAAWLGTAGCHPEQSASDKKCPRPAAMVLFNPVYDNGPDNGWGYQRTGEKFPLYSPAHNIGPHAPPHLVFLGSADSLIPVAVAERFQQRMEAAGVISVLKIYEGQPHGFFNYGKDKNRWFNETVKEMDQFLKEQGLVVGE